MCQPATCKNCGKASYRGCGMHVEQVLAGVPQSQRCSCAADQPARSDRPAARPASAATAQRGGFVARLFGRR